MPLIVPPDAVMLIGNAALNSELSSLPEAQTCAVTTHPDAIEASARSLPGPGANELPNTGENVARPVASLGRETAPAK